MFSVFGQEPEEHRDGNNKHRVRQSAEKMGLMLCEQEEGANHEEYDLGRSREPQHTSRRILYLLSVQIFLLPSRDRLD